jgi:serine/threonine-protein kinase RsbW
MPPLPDLSAPQDARSLTFTADPAAVRTALAQLLSAAPVQDLPEDDRGTVELVLAEVLNNVAEHAYVGGSGPVKVDLFATPLGLACRIVDRGLAMPGGKLPEGGLPDLAPPDFPEGGFGWHLIHSLTADLTYARRAGQNRLSFLIPFARTDQDQTRL